MSKITICHYSSNTTIERLYQRNLINATQGNSQNSRKKQASKDNTDSFANNIIQKKKQSCLTRHCLPFEIRKEIYWVYLQLLLSWRWCFQILACEQQLDRWLCWRRMLRTRLRPADPLAGLKKIWIKIFGIQNKFVWNSKHDAWNLTGLGRLYWTQNFLLRLPVFSSSRPDVFFIKSPNQTFFIQKFFEPDVFLNISHNQMVF